MNSFPHSWLLKYPIAHRGLHDSNVTIPENSLSAFRKSIQAGYSIELDIHILKDGNLAVFHDDTLTRMCKTDSRINDLDAISIKNYNLINSQEKIPLLQEVLDIINDRVPLLIEIKNTAKVGEAEAALMKQMRNYKGRFAIQSFNPFSIAWFKTNYPDVPRGQLSGNFRSEKMNFIIKKVLQNFLFNWKSKPHFIGYDIHALPNKKVSRLRRKGLPVLGWTVRTEQEYKAIAAYCDNIIFENIEPI